MVESFYIDLDPGGLQDQFNGVHRSYTELGVALQQNVRDVRQDLSNLAAASSGAYESVSLPPSLELNVDQLGSHLREMQRRVPEIQAVLKKLEEFHRSSKDPSRAMQVLSTAQEQVFGLPEAGRVEAVSERAQDLVLFAMEHLDKLMEDNESWGSKIKEFIESEKKGVWSSIKSVGKSLPASLTSGFLGALLSSVFLGYSEMNRRAQEMGEMTNIFEAGTESVFSSGSTEAVQWFSAWGENAQFFWGVGRKEVQGALKVMVDNGFKSADMLTEFDSGLGEVGKNIVTLTLGLGKHYNDSTVAHMEEAVSLVRDYGMSLSSAGSLLVKMAAAGEHSGIGVKNFTRIVMASADPLSHMGIGAESIALVVKRLLGAYESMGLNSQYAGHEVEAVVSDLFTAFSNMNDRLKIAIMRDMDHDTTTDSRKMLIEFEDGLRRVHEGKSSDFLEKMIKSYVNVALSRSTGERSLRIDIVMNSLGVENLTAQRFVDFLDLFTKAGHLSAMKKDSVENLKKAFSNEGTQVDDLYKSKREMILGASKMGEGILALIMDLISITLLTLQERDVLARTPKSKKPFAALLFLLKNLEIVNNMKGAYREAVSGAKGILGSSPEEIQEVFRPFSKIFGGFEENAAPGKAPPTPAQQISQDLTPPSNSVQPWNAVPAGEQSKMPPAPEFKTPLKDYSQYGIPGRDSAPEVPEKYKLAAPKTAETPKKKSTGAKKQKPPAPVADPLARADTVRPPSRDFYDALWEQSIEAGANASSRMNSLV